MKFRCVERMGSERSLLELRSLAAICEGFGGSPTLDNARKVLDAESKLEAMSLTLRELQVISQCSLRLGPVFPSQFILFFHVLLFGASVIAGNTHVPFF